MGSLIGHVLPGVAFLIISLWHLFNQIKLHTLQPNSYTSFPWFSSSKSRYMELYLLIIANIIYLAIELFIAPSKHHPFDIDGTIPSNHLRNFEHASISFFFLIYAFLAIILDKSKSHIKNNLTTFIGTLAFAHELYLFHLHSTDHHGLEGQYHFLLQIIVFVTFISTLLGIGYNDSFLISFIRSVSIFFQGIWFTVTGFMLWTPFLIPKGCLINNEDGHKIVRCSTDEALSRAKSLVNIEFSGYLILITVLAVYFYLILFDIYNRKKQDLPLQKKKIENENKVDHLKRIFLEMGRDSTHVTFQRVGDYMHAASYGDELKSQLLSG